MGVCLGQSTAVGIGGDPFNGASFIDVLEKLEDDAGEEMAECTSTPVLASTASCLQHHAVRQSLLFAVGVVWLVLGLPMSPRARERAKTPGSRTTGCRRGFICGNGAIIMGGKGAAKSRRSKTFRFYI